MLVLGLKELIYQCHRLGANLLLIQNIELSYLRSFEIYLNFETSIPQRFRYILAQILH